MTLVARAHLLLCGVGEEEENLRRLAVELGIERRTHFLGFRDDVPALLGASDVFLFPSYQEGLPMSQMEAMAAGCPAWSATCAANRDLISPGDGGYLRKPDDWRGMCEDICRLLEDPALRKSMGDRQPPRRNPLFAGQGAGKHGGPVPVAAGLEGGRPLARVLFLMRYALAGDSLRAKFDGPAQRRWPPGGMKPM